EGASERLRNLCGSSAEALRSALDQEVQVGSYGRSGRFTDHSASERLRPAIWQARLSHEAGSMFHTQASPVAETMKSLWPSGANSAASSSVEAAAWHHDRPRIGPLPTALRGPH